MKLYIGDSVYVDFDGFAIILTTENGYHDDPRNRIVLEPEVLASLFRYVEQLKARLASAEEHASQAEQAGKFGDEA